MSGAPAPPKGRTTALDRPLVFYTMDENRLALIRHKVSSGKRAVMPTDQELAGFLELLAKYDLDAMADEAWLSKTAGRNGGDPKLLVMVGRNGLRKIARRQKLALAGDVVHAKDKFKVKWTRDPETRRRELLIEHEYEGADEDARGAILGAWAEVYREEDGAQMGYFFAPIGEYKPTNADVLKFSPWGHQESIMIITAAERSALRQATPLGGLLAEGEEALIEGDAPELNETDLIRELVMDLDISVGLKSELFDAIEKLNVASPNAWGIGRAQMTLPGRDDASILREIEDIKRQTAQAEERAARDRRAAVEEVTDAVVVPEVPEGLDPDAWESALSYFKGDVKLAEESLRRSSQDPENESGDPVAENAPDEPRMADGRRYGEAPAAGDVAEAAGEAARGNPGPQEDLRLDEDVRAVDAGPEREPYPCPNCDKDWNTEHTQEEQQACLRAYDQEDGE